MPTPDNAGKIDAIFARARLVSDPAQRASYLDEACGGDRELRAEIDSLLAADQAAGGFLECKTLTVPATLATAKSGDCIGRYKLLEKIGEGGFGEVWMAEQEQPVRRRVALKIIKLGMDTKEVVARFEAERQALALMDHPNIAKVLDGGATEAGRPYFVMELVRGVPITDYCDRNNLSTDERLQLFIKVCHAVQHAHQKAVIHRDLKPSNILVTLHDGDPVPKVIDFGVAKALGQKLTEKTLFTAFRQMIGTPAYMSPEQAEMSGLDVDTRSDIYSLGVLLYELLTGVTPFDKEALAKVALDEIRRLIREIEPPKPSTRLRTLGEKITDVAKRRHTEPAALSRHISGDLDWIVMKCLEKDRSHRYETASALGRDLECHLNDQPVSAVAPSLFYRLSKFIKRHQTTMVRSTAAFLIGSLVVSVFFWLLGGRGPRWFPDIRPGARAVNTPPHLDFERGISDVYIPDYSVTGPGVRMVGSERYLFIRLKPGPGGWRAFDLVGRQLANTHTQSVAYITAQDGKRVFELGVDAKGLVSRPYPDGPLLAISPTPATRDNLGMLIAVSRLVRGLVVCALPQQGMLFAFDPQSGHVVWTNRAADHLSVTDTRIGNVTANDDVVAAGLWGSRVWIIDAATGQHRWARETCRYGNPIQIAVAGSRVFGFAADQKAYAFELATGRQVWERLVGRSDNEESVVVHGMNLILWQPPGTWAGGSRVLAIRQEDGSEQWQIPLLTNHWGGGISGSGDFVVAVSARILQRIEPRTGTAGAFLELPTLKKSVMLFGRETSVFVSHPMVLVSPDTVYAFTVDGSLWCVHLPQASTSVVTPSHETTRQSREAIPEQMATTNGPTPALPAELGTWRAELEHDGQASLWTEWEAKIDEVWAEAQDYAREYGGFPHVVIGRVVVPKPDDPRQVLTQMKILQGGYFATAIKDLQQPLCFRLPGCLPVDVPLKGHSGELIFVGDVVMPAVAPGQVGGIRGRIRMQDGSDAQGAQVSASISMGPINHMSNGSEPRQFFPDPIGGRVAADGEFLLQALSPTEHDVNIQAHGFLPVTKNVAVRPGDTNVLGDVLLERPLSAQVSWLVEEQPNFATAQQRKAVVFAGQAWKSKPSSDGRSDLWFKQRNGRLYFDCSYGPCKITDLGVRPLEGTLTLDVGFLTFEPPRSQVEAGHVYLFRQEAFSPPYWVLLRIDAIVSTLAQRTEAKPISPSESSLRK
jgi:serine/threonine protein kinase/outer membrane protein assembly factor BamB